MNVLNINGSLEEHTLINMICLNTLKKRLVEKLQSNLKEQLQQFAADEYILGDNSTIKTQLCTTMKTEPPCADEFKMIKEEIDSDDKVSEPSTQNLLADECDEYFDDNRTEISDIVKDEIDLKCETNITSEDVDFFNKKFVPSSSYKEQSVTDFAGQMLKNEAVDLDQEDNDLIPGPEVTDFVSTNADQLTNYEKENVKVEQSVTLDDQIDVNNDPNDLTCSSFPINKTATIKKIETGKKSAGPSPKRYDWCRNCRKRFGRSPANSKRPRACPICGHKLRRLGDARVKPKPYGCNICRKQFSAPSYLTKHMRTHTQEKPYACAVCARAFSSLSNARTHMRTHTREKPFACDVCGRRFSNSSHVTAHKRTHTQEKPFKCAVCARRFRFSSGVLVHMRTHTNEQPYKCAVCARRFRFSSSIAKHMRTHAATKPHKCDVCGRAYSKSTLLARHARTHLDRCPICGRMFSKAAHVTRHMRTHTADKPYQCTQCAKTFRERAHLTVHMRTHTSVKPFGCPRCEKRFTAASSVAKHVRMHTDERPYKCAVCAKTFRTSSNAAAHMRTHSAAKPYRCVVCERTFREAAALARHARTHSDERPYQCDQCTRTFRAAWSLTKHTRAKHSFTYCSTENIHTDAPTSTI